MAKAELDIAPPGDGIPFGAMVSGLTQVQLRDQSVRRALFDLWIEQGVILFRGGEATSEMHVELSRCFGELEPHPFPESTEPGFPDLVKIKFYPEDGTYYDVGGEQRGGWLPWHSDLIYTDRINRGGILRPVQLPQNLGMTGFIDQIAAWERLPARLKDKIEGLNVVYAVDMDFSRQLFAHDGNVRCLRMAASGTAYVDLSQGDPPHGVRAGRDWSQSSQCFARLCPGDSRNGRARRRRSAARGDRALY